MKSHVKKVKEYIIQNQNVKIVIYSNCGILRESKKCFNNFMTSCDILQPVEAVSFNELKEAFFPLKMKKIAGCNYIDKICFIILHILLLHISTFNCPFNPRNM